MAKTTFVDGNPALGTPGTIVAAAFLNALQNHNHVDTTAEGQGGEIPNFNDNLLINSNFKVNQRAYVSGTATGGANQYTLDRWRVVTSGQNLTFSESNGVVTATAPAGGIEQVVEGVNIIGGTYTLNWSGTATATVNGGAVAKGGQVTLTGGSNATVKFSGGTVITPKLESGGVATPYKLCSIQNEETRCKRYYEIGKCGMQGYAAGAGNNIACRYGFKVSKRVTPTVAVVGNTVLNCATPTAAADTPEELAINAVSSGAGQVSWTANFTASAEL